jgi:hypothetical protein
LSGHAVEPRIANPPPVLYIFPEPKAVARILKLLNFISSSVAVAPTVTLIVNVVVVMELMLRAVISVPEPMVTVGPAAVLN